MSVKYFCDPDGKYIGAFDGGASPNVTAFEVPTPPDDARQFWDFHNQSWGEIPLPAKTRLYKSTLIRRMSPAEAAHFEGVLAAEEPWVRMLYHSVEWFGMSDALVSYMHMVLSQDLGVSLGDEPGGPFTLGEARADELLAPEI